MNQLNIQSAISQSVLENGFAIVPDVLSTKQVCLLREALTHVTEPSSVRRHEGGSVYALRNLLEISPEIQALSQSETVRTLVDPLLGDACLPVRGILFDKVPNANWKVPFHQDVTIAVRSRVDVEGFGSWSMKNGVLHTQPPVSILDMMLSVRLHLDDCHEQNGALRVIPGSHLLGRIAESDIDSTRRQLGEQLCSVPVGGALLMRPLLLHASSPAESPEHRRVVHVDYASGPLPSGLQWFQRSGNNIDRYAE